jgi:hypothetical protein
VPDLPIELSPGAWRPASQKSLSLIDIRLGGGGVLYCVRQFGTAAATRKVSLSAEPLGLSFPGRADVCLGARKPRVDKLALPKSFESLNLSLIKTVIR